MSINAMGSLVVNSGISLKRHSATIAIMSSNKRCTLSSCCFLNQFLTSMISNLGMESSSSFFLWDCLDGEKRHDLSIDVHDDMTANRTRPHNPHFHFE
mmetsp:Transcript_23279/g.32554  ORF Transcript_23279/g.32554 Transcript_23279/m.32554 type:complete len:98 (+) Transcript_23279:714-1007(+)